MGICRAQNGARRESRARQSFIAMLHTLEILNALELDGTRLPGFVHAVANHLATVSGNIALLTGRDVSADAAARAAARINQSTRDIREEINRLQAARRPPVEETLDGVLPIFPALVLPQVAGALEEEFHCYDWEVQYAQVIDERLVARVEIRWLRHAVRCLLEISGETPGLAVFHTSRGGSTGAPEEFRVRLLHDRAAGGPLPATARDALAAARHLLAAMGGTLDARTSDTIAQFTLSLPLVGEIALQPMHAEAA